MAGNQKQSKTTLAKKLGVSRGSLYYKPKREVEDERVRKLILTCLSIHPSYGHRRIAMQLDLNHKRILRIMKKFGIKPYRRRVQKPAKPKDLTKKEAAFKNEIELFCPIRANVCWAGDFTYLGWQGKWYFLATILDLYTREVLAWNLKESHTSELVIKPFKEALAKRGRPQYFHSDQGSEYDSSRYVRLIESCGVTFSMSRKSHPWENGHQESFYSNFKLELGDLDRCKDLGELHEAVSIQIHYYNYHRIHTKLKTSPAKFKEARDKVFKEAGT
jgi:transposase InsO family protein